jgi:hypothetical protein
MDAATQTTLVENGVASWLLEAINQLPRASVVCPRFERQVRA